MGEVEKQAASPTMRLHRFDVLKAWFAEYMAVTGFQPRSMEDYLRELSLFRRWVEATTDVVDIDELSAETLHDYSAYLYGRGLAAAGMYRKVAILRSFFGSCYRENKLYIDYTQYLHMPRVPSSLPVDMLSESQMQRVFGWLESRSAALESLTRDSALHLRDHALWELAYGTGMRRAELRALELGDMHWSDGVVLIRRGKGGKPRVAPLGLRGMALVRRYVEQARPLLRPCCEALLVSWRGKPLDKWSIVCCVRRTLEAAGIQRRVTLHSLRHACATHMLNHGADIRYVQELLGHASLGTTQVYTRVSIGKLKDTHRRHHPREQAGF